MNRDKYILDLIYYIKSKDEVFTFSDLKNEVKINFNLSGEEISNEEIDTIINVALWNLEEKGILNNIKNVYINRNVIIKVMNQILNKEGVFNIQKLLEDNNSVLSALEENDLKKLYQIILDELEDNKYIAQVNGKYISLKINNIVFSENVVYLVPSDSKEKSARSM